MIQGLNCHLSSRGSDGWRCACGDYVHPHTMSHKADGSHEINRERLMETMKMSRESQQVSQEELTEAMK